MIFVSTACPISNGYNDRMKAVSNDYSAKGVHFIFINANSSESPAEIAEHAKAHGFPFAVYKDANGAAADLFGAQVTPETYVMDKDGVLRYHGYVDDSVTEARVTTMDCARRSMPCSPAKPCRWRKRRHSAAPSMPRRTS